VLYSLLDKHHHSRERYLSPKRRVAEKKVAALMGHSNLNTTSIYTIPSALDLEHAVAQIDE